jgi:hypothetical protein
VLLLIVKKIAKIASVVGIYAGCWLVLNYGITGILKWKIGVKAEIKTITATADFDEGKYVGTEADSVGGQLRLKSAGEWGPVNGTVPNVILGNGAVTVSDGNYVYLMANSDNYFARYITSEDRWENLANSPHYAYPGADLVYFDNYIYAIFGGYQKEFSRYSILDNRWTEMTMLPDLVYGGASLETNGTEIFCLRGYNTTDFWKYNVSGNSWSTISSAPATIYLGANLVYGQSTNKLYTPRGNSSNTFYMYDLGTSSWSVGPTMPIAINENRNIAIGGTMIYVTRGVATTAFWGFNIGTTIWTNLAGTPQANRYVGSVYNQSDDKVYVFRGNGRQDFWRFDPATRQFDGPPDLPIAPGTGSDFNYWSGNMYYLRGGSGSMYRSGLGIGATWQTLAVAPVSFSTDTKGVVAGNLMYFLQGGGNRNFYSFNPAVGVGGTWATLATMPAAIAPNYGAGLAYPGSGNYIYATRGALTRTFMRYTIGVGETWDDLAVADLPDDAEAGYGSRIIGVGTTELFYIGGNGIARMLKYNITSDSWSMLGNLPFSPYYGTDMTYYNGKIYAHAGFYKKDIWEYTIGSNTWRRLGDVPGYNATELGPYNGASIEADGAGNIYSNAGLGILWVRKYGVGASNYSASGSWVSGTMDLGYVSEWSGLTVGVSTPGDSSVVINTRSSSDKTNWSSWGQVSGSVISSPEARYLQVGVTLNSSSGGSDTPGLKDISINYVGDTGVPTNPNTITGLSSQVGGVGITSGVVYPYNQPYFSWGGATDSQTAVEGYYVYFGQGSTATVNPAIDGSYQTESNYLVTKELETGSYNLLIKTKDTAGNVSSTWQAFEYEYDGVSPYVSLVQTSTVDFTAGTSAGVEIGNNQIKLSGRNGFWQQERLSVTSQTIGDGGDFVTVGQNLYILRGASSNTFYIYNLLTDVITVGQTTPATVLGGGALVNGPNGYIYALRGGNNSSFWRYDIGASSWSDQLAADTPQPVNQGASMEFDGAQYIYVLKGNADDTFMRYDALNDVWEVLGANTDFGSPERQLNNLVGLGGDLAIDVGNSRVYAIQGGLRTGFSSYDINAGLWTTLPNTPAMAYNGGRIEYDSTIGAIFYIPGWDKPFLYKYDISSQTWTELNEAPGVFGYGASVRKIGNYLYFLRGASTSILYKYKISTNSWVVPNWNLFGGWWRGTDNRNFGDGADMVRGEGDNLYITRGGYDNLFVKYNGTTGEVTKLADVPAGIYRGSELVYDNVAKKIYASTSINDKKFLVYDVESDNWSQVVGGGGTLPTDAGEGSALAFDGSEFIYRLRGGNTNTFHRFSVNTGLWTTLPNTPAAMQYGGDLVKNGDYMYATRGVGTTAFYRFGPLSGVGVWTSAPTVSYLPAGAVFNYDGFLAGNGNGTIIGCRGGNTANCLRYSVAGNSWTDVGVSAPAQVTYGGAGVLNQAGDKLYMIAGAGTNTYANGIYSYVIPTANSAVGESGTYISPVYDLNTIYKIANLEIGYSGALNSSMVAYTRTSNDGVNWEGWNLVSSEKKVGNMYSYRVVSGAKRYFQLKLELTSGDGIYSGVVDGYKLNYYQDDQEPINSVVLNAFENVGMDTTLVSGTFYGTTAPYFSWPQVGQTGAATDGEGGSGIQGYFVYFGLGATADPKVYGSYVTTNTYVGATMTTGKNYYFRMKAKDWAGNVASEVGSTFVFGFDASAPSNPVTITSDPQGYTATNNYSFYWSGAGDTGAGVAGYYYKTGAVGASEVYTVGTSVVGITAYQTGTNTFYVKTKDQAGNVSDYSTASYYYSATAPGAPRDLVLTYPEVGTSNTVNEFAFSWSTPDPDTYFGQQSGLRYYYSFNETPSVSNTNEIGLSLTYLSKGAYATRKGTNTLYVVAKDEAGNIDYRNFADIDFVAETAAPGMPRNIDISDVSIKETNNWRLALSWDTPEATGSGVATYKIYRSEEAGASCTGDMTGFSSTATSSVTSYVDPELEQVAYYYCVKACDSTNECGAPSDTVTLKPDGKWRVPPTLTSEPTVVVKTKSAVIDWTTNRKSNSFVKYGKNSGDYGDEVGSSDQVSSHSISLTGLDPGTTYYYKVLWTDEDGNTGESSEGNFQTNPAPLISAVAIEDVGLYSAYVKFNLANAVKVKVLYGITTSYGGVSELTTSTTSSLYTMKIDNLSEGSQYHLQLVALDDEGNTFTSDDYLFETLPVPKISGVKIQQVRGAPTATIRVVWKTNTGVSSVITYFPKDNPEQVKDQIQLALTENHQLIIDKLEDDTQYVVIVKGKDVAGNEATAEKIDFKTSLDLRAPEISDLRAEGVTTGVGEQAKGQVVINWRTDEPASSQVEYGEGTGTDYSSKTAEESRLAEDHALSIPDLKPGMVYHLRVVSKDVAGNVAVSFDSIVVIPKATRSALDLVVNSLSKSFGFFNGLTKIGAR